jgi:hypothetical protein
MRRRGVIEFAEDAKTAADGAEMIEIAELWASEVLVDLLLRRAAAKCVNIRSPMLMGKPPKPFATVP